MCRFASGLQRQVSPIACSCLEPGAARPEHAAYWAFARQGDVARYRRQHARMFAGADVGDAVDQPLRIGMPWLAEQGLGRSFLNELARIHDADPVAALGDESEIMRDEEETGRVAAAKFS